MAASYTFRLRSSDIQKITDVSDSKIVCEALSVQICVICGRLFLRALGQSDKGRGGVSFELEFEF